MAISFAEKFEAIQKTRQSNLILRMLPRVSRLPLPIQRYDDPFLPFGKAIINATQDMVCGYMFDLAAYLALGAAGIIALERTLPYVDSSSIRILHGPFAGPDYAAAAFEGNFDLDAVTLVNEGDLPAYTTQPWRGAFVVMPGSMSDDLRYGAYWQNTGLLTLPDVTGKQQKMRVAGESVLYAGRGDDFTEQVRTALEKLHDE
jgi:hypothetical protein